MTYGIWLRDRYVIAASDWDHRAITTQEFNIFLGLLLVVVVVVVLVVVGVVLVMKKYKLWCIKKFLKYNYLMIYVVVVVLVVEVVVVVVVVLVVIVVVVVVVVVDVVVVDVVVAVLKDKQRNFWISVLWFTADFKFSVKFFFL